MMKCEWSERIRGSLEKALDTISDIIPWEYSNSKGAPLTDSQLGVPSAYEEFVSIRNRFKNFAVILYI